ncbi:MAG: flippase [Candidatus Paceibacterota bacterium]
MIQRVKSFLLENKTTGQTIAKNTFWLFFGSILSRFLKAVILIYAARVMGTTEWGVFSYVLSLAALFTIFVDFGINAIITRESARDISLQHKYFSTALLVKILFLFIVICAVVLGAPYFVKQHEVLILIPLTLFMLGLDGLRDFGATLSRAWDRMEVESFVQVFTNAIIALVGFLSLYISRTAYSLVWGYVAGTGLGMIVAFYPYRSYFKNLWNNFDKKLAKKILVSCWPFGMLGVMGAIMLNTDTIMVGWFGTIDDVGYYGAAQRIIQIIYMIPALLATAFFPSMSRAIKDSELLRKLLERGVSLLMLFAIPLTVGGFLLSRQIIQLLYGSLYYSAAGPFGILSLTFVPAFIAIMFGNAFFALNKEKKLIAYVLIGIFGNFLFNLLLIPLFGIEGAAISTVLNQVILTLYLIHFLRKELQFRILHQIEKLIGATVAMALILLLFRMLEINLYINIFISMVVYAIALFLLREESVIFVWNKAMALRKGNVPQTEIE